MEHAATEPDLPSPIPWLGKAGPVPALDRIGVSSSAPSGGERRVPPPTRRHLPLVPAGVRHDARVGAAPSPTEATPVAASTAPSGTAAAKKRAVPKKKRPGSGIPARPVIRALVWARRAAQAGFLGLFLFFLVQTTFRGAFSATSETPVRLPWPVEGFLLTDPFVGAMTLL